MRRDGDVRGTLGALAVGALAGFVWAAGFRAFMVELAGPDSRFDWYATFVAVLLAGAIVGGLLGLAERWRRTGGRRRWRLLALAPLLFGVLPLTVPGTLDQLDEGIGTAGMAVALLAIGTGFGFGSVARPWIRVLVGAVSLAGIVALAAAAPAISDGRVDFGEPRGAWAGVLALGSMLLLGLATSIPFRPLITVSENRPTR